MGRSVIPPPEIAKVVPNEEDLVTVLFPANAVMVRGDWPEQMFLTVEPEEDETGVLQAIQFRLSEVGETAAWFNLPLEEAVEFFATGLAIVQWTMANKGVPPTE